MKFKGSVLYIITFIFLCSCTSLVIESRIPENDEESCSAGCVDLLMNREGIKDVNSMIESWNRLMIGISSTEIYARNQCRVQDVKTTCFGDNCITGIHREEMHDSEVRFRLTINKSVPEARVTLRLESYASDHVKMKWKESIENTWSGRVRIVSGKDKYPVIVEVYWMNDSDFYAKDLCGDNDFHYFVNCIASGRSDMTTWALDDPDAAVHEAGHMLGNCDEYGIVNGVNYICNKNDSEHDFYKGTCKWRTHIMHCKYGKPTLENYHRVLSAARSLIGDDHLRLEYIE